MTSVGQIKQLLRTLAELTAKLDPDGSSPIFQTLVGITTFEKANAFVNCFLDSELKLHIFALENGLGWRVEVEKIIRQQAEELLQRVATFPNDLIRLRVSWDHRQISDGSVGLFIIPLHDLVQTQAWYESFPIVLFDGSKLI